MNVVFRGASRIARIAAALFCLAALSFGQSNLATVTGVVTDESGGVIPGATVMVRNTGTNDTRELSTNEAGNYTVTSLIPGNYEVTVQSDGFTTYIQQGLTLQTGDSRRIDVILELGQVTESVTVDAQVVTLNTENGAIKGDVIVMEEIQELPLNGRDFTDLAFFTTGVVPNESAQGSFASINGARPTNTNFYVDGFDNRNARGAAAQVRPNIDALQEFKMETSGYSAEYGKMAGGIINMSLRSGTNEFHGNLSYFLRDDVLDARGFFDSDKTKLSQNQFSGTIAGPIKKNKMFFMFSYEMLRRDQENTRLTAVPTPLEIGGDFSQSVDVRNVDNSQDITDPTVLANLQDRFVIRDRLASGGCNINRVRRGQNNSCFPNDIIPASRLDPIGQRLFQEYPLPTFALGERRDLFNYRVVDLDNDNFDSFIGKVDKKYGENTLAIRGQYRANNNENPFQADHFLKQFRTSIDDNRYLAGADYTHIFSPTFLLEVRGGVSGNSARQVGAFAGQDIAAELGLPNQIPPDELALTPELNDWPRIQIDNYTNLGTPNNQPVQFDVTDFQGGIKMTNIMGSHTMKWGYNYSFVRFQQPGINNARGTYRFRGNRTNHPIADIALGWLNNINRRTGINRPDWRQQSMGLFFNDDWKATRRLTLNLGVRWEVTQMPIDKFDRMGSFVPALNQIVISSDENLPSNFAELSRDFELEGKVLTAQDAGLPRSVIRTDYNNFYPRLGIAYKVTDKTVIRTGYGLFQAGTILNPFRNQLSNVFPFTINQNFQGQNGNPDLVSLKNPNPDNRLRVQGSANAFGITQRINQSYLQSWNFTIERQLPFGTALEADYRGSKGTFLIRRYDANQPFRSVDAWLAGSNANSLRPNQDWNAINFFNTGSNSSYNSANISWRKRSRGGLFWRVNYSFSKSVDDSSRTNGSGETDFANALDSRNLRLDRGRSSWDRTHVFTAVASYELPWGKGRRWGANWNSVTNGLLGGWQLSGTQTAYSGSPFTVTVQNVDLNAGESPRPNRISDGRVYNRDVNGAKRGADVPFYDANAFVGVPVCDEDQDPQCPAGAFQLGSAGRNILDGPGTLATNVALSKNFTVKEGWRLQVRLESFNLFNRVNFRMTDEFRQFNGIGGGFFTQVGNFGRQGGPRIFQYALKLRF